MSSSSDNSGFVPGGYHTERLDDVSTRLARVEGKMDGLATKEDVANAKYGMLMYWIGMAVAVLIGIGGIVARFWPA